MRTWNFRIYIYIFFQKIGFLQVVPQKDSGQMAKHKQEKGWKVFTWTSLGGSKKLNAPRILWQLIIKEALSMGY